MQPAPLHMNLITEEFHTGPHPTQTLECGRSVIGLLSALDIAVAAG